MHYLYLKQAGKRILMLAAALVLVAAPLLTSADEASDYEIWALDQGTHKIHIFDASLEEIASIDLGADGMRVPHMVDFSSDYRYAAIANVGSGNVAIIRTEDRHVVSVVDTGPRSHMAGFSPDDSVIHVDVIGSPDNERDGQFVEIAADLDNERFQVSRRLTIAEDPLFRENADRFRDVAAICHQYNSDGSRAFVTLGPGLDDGGLVVVDTAGMKLERVWGPDDLAVNCGTMLTPDGRHMMLNGGGHDVGVWHAVDVDTLELTRSEESSGGIDAHGVRNLPNGEEIWMVNRGTSDGIVIDANSLQKKARIPDTGQTPDILDFSPDSRYAFVTLRGPNPVSMPHMAKGDTPGFSVIDVRTRELVKIVEPAKGNENSDFHGIGVRVLD